MSERPRPDHLSATRPYVLLLRLSVGPDGRDVKGEVVDPETNRARPFARLERLGDTVREWLERQQSGQYPRPME